MSRLGKKPIKVPKTIEAEIKGNILRLKGPKGEVEYKIPAGIKLAKEENLLKVIASSKKRGERVAYGLARATIANLIKGINKGFVKKLELFGVGYTAKLEGENLILTLGYSHPITIKKPEGVEIKTEKNELSILGIDRQKVGQFAAEIHDLKRAEPYKGKGFKYVDEVIRRKVGKAALKTEGEVVSK